MRVTDRGDGEFREIAQLCNLCFKGVERPPELALRYNYDTGELSRGGSSVSRPSQL